MPILQESKNRFFVSIPTDIIKLKNWHKGQDLIWVACEDNSIKLKEISK